MGFLLLAFAVSLAYVEAQLDPSEINGNWRSLAIGADNVEKIRENGDLRVYLRHAHCFEGCNQISFRFFVKKNGECKDITTLATKGENDVYFGDYAGRNVFRILDKTDDLVTLFNHNVDEEGKETRGILLAGRRNFLTEEEKQRFAALVEERGIPLENIQPITETDTCPE